VTEEDGPKLYIIIVPLSALVAVSTLVCLIVIGRKRRTHVEEPGDCGHLKDAAGIFPAKDEDGGPSIALEEGLAALPQARVVRPSRGAWPVCPRRPSVAPCPAPLAAAAARAVWEVDMLLAPAPRRALGTGGGRHRLMLPPVAGAAHASAKAEKTAGCDGFAASHADVSLELALGG